MISDEDIITQANDLVEDWLEALRDAFHESDLSLEDLSDLVGASEEDLSSILIEDNLLFLDLPLYGRLLVALGLG